MRLYVCIAGDKSRKDRRVCICAGMCQSRLSFRKNSTRVAFMVEKHRKATDWHRRIRQMVDALRSKNSYTLRNGNTPHVYYLYQNIYVMAQNKLECRTEITFLRLFQICTDNTVLISENINEYREVWEQTLFLTVCQSVSIAAINKLIR